MRIAQLAIQALSISLTSGPSLHHAVCLHSCLIRLACYSLFTSLWCAVYVAECKAHVRHGTDANHKQHVIRTVDMHIARAQRLKFKLQALTEPRILYHAKVWPIW